MEGWSRIKLYFMIYGFNPKPKISIASPLSLGIESEKEWMDIELLKEIDRESFIRDVDLKVDHESISFKRIGQRI